MNASIMMWESAKDRLLTLHDKVRSQGTLCPRCPDSLVPDGSRLGFDMSHPDLRPVIVRLLHDRTFTAQTVTAGLQSAGRQHCIALFQRHR